MSYSSKVLAVLTRHVGRENAIGMGELYARVYGRPWRNRINDTRELRRIITELRYDGALIGETRSRQGGGYYLARSTSELEEFFSRRTREAIKKLYMVSRMKKIALPEMLGQLSLELQACLPSAVRQACLPSAVRQGGEKDGAA